MCPFDELLGFDSSPSVAFEADPADETAVVGKAVRDISSGEALSKLYDDSSVGEVIFNHGFVPPAPLDGDTVGIPAEVLLRICGRAEARADRCAQLQAAMLLGEDSFGGEDLTVELSRCAHGTAQLVAACLALQAGDEMWGAGVAEGKDVFDAPSDAAAASLCQCFCEGVDFEALSAIAEECSTDEADPWPALLQSCQGQLPSGALEAAAAAAARAIAERAQMLAAAPLPASSPRDDRGAAAWAMASALHTVERTILDEARTAVDGPLAALH